MGEGHGGWILREVRVREVTLQNGGLTETLSLPPPGLQQSNAPAMGMPATSVPPNGAPDNL
jgi:hypothetical protein